MKQFVVTFREKSKPPLPKNTSKSQWIEAEDKEEIFKMLYERLHLTKKEFNARYEIVEVRYVRGGLN